MFLPMHTGVWFSGILRRLWGKRDSRLACQWSVPLREGSPSVNEEQLEGDNTWGEEHNHLPADPSLKRDDCNTA